MSDQSHNRSVGRQRRWPTPGTQGSAIAGDFVRVPQFCGPPASVGDAWNPGFGAGGFRRGEVRVVSILNMNYLDISFVKNFTRTP